MSVGFETGTKSGRIARSAGLLSSSRWIRSRPMSSAMSNARPRNAPLSPSTAIAAPGSALQRSAISVMSASSSSVSAKITPSRDSLAFISA